MSVQSKELTYFYHEYKKWLYNGAPDMQPFWRASGLCSSIEFVSGHEEKTLVERELKGQFEVNGLDSIYPFGELNFDTRCFEKTQHLDPLRIKWVEDHLKPEFTGEY